MLNHIRFVKFNILVVPIIARFLRYGDKQLVMDRARKYLKNTAFNIYDDIPKPLYDSRKGQLKKLREAREKARLHRLLQ